MRRFTIESAVSQFDYLEKITSEYPSRISDFWDAAVRYGWYHSPYLPDKLGSRTLESQGSIDSIMCKKFESNYENTKEYVLNRSRERTKIITEAYRLHEEGNYIACIPLFLAQSDGIFNDVVGVSVFTRKEKLLKKIISFIGREAKERPICKAFFSNFSIITQFHEKSNSKGQEMRLVAPNRNGVLHGDKCHLDYDTYMNSCKTINLLSSVVWLEDKIGKV